MPECKTPSDQGFYPRVYHHVFAVAVLCLLLGWAEGVRKDTTYLHILQNGGWLIATGILTAFGFLLLFWSRGTKRS